MKIRLTTAAVVGAACLVQTAAAIPIPSLPRGREAAGAARTPVPVRESVAARTPEPTRSPTGTPSPVPDVPTAAPSPAASPAPALTEFLERWDRDYRLFDPEIDAARRGGAKDYARGVAELKKAILTGIPDEGMYYRLGFCYEKLGDNDRALDAYRRAEAPLPGAEAGEWSCALPYHTGLVLARKGRHAEAAAEFEKAARCPEYAAAAHNNLGNCYRNLYLKRKALEEFEAALSIEPAMVEAQINMGVTRAELGDAEGAASALRRALDLDPRAPGAAYSLGVVRLARGDRKGAEEAFLRAVAAFPRDEKAHLALARLYLEAGRKEEARQEARIAFGLMPMLKADNLELDTALGAPPPAAATPRPSQAREGTLLEQARTALAGGDHAGAERAYGAVLAENPNSVAACLGMAYLCEFAGPERYGNGFPAERSIAFYRKALDAQPGMSTAWFSLGNVYEKRGRNAEAAAAFEKARECAPEMKFAWYNAGVCFARLGEREKAEERFREAIRLDPDFAGARSRLAEALASKRDFGGAVTEYEKVLALAPSDADAHFNLGQIYRRQTTDRRKAAEHLKAYLELSPDAPDAAEIQGWIRDLEE